MAPKPKTPAEATPDLTVKSQAVWAAWLERHHHTSKGVWLVLAKKGSGRSSPTYAEALEEALRFGWIDGQKGARDAATWAQRFTPRGPKSLWSKINVDKADALIASKRMRPAGLAAVEAAKRDGRWAKAYASQRVAEVPEDLRAALEGNPKAKAFFATLTGANRYAILFRTHNAKKADTRQKRIAHFVAMLARGETIH